MRWKPPRKGDIAESWFLRLPHPNRNNDRHGCQMAKFDPILSLDCARVEGVEAQSKERKGSNFAIWQPWVLETMIPRYRPFSVVSTSNVNLPPSDIDFGRIGVAKRIKKVAALDRGCAAAAANVG